MKCVVTGAAGFLGSHLCERLVAEGHDVVGVDSFLDYYPREVKERNLDGLARERRFTLVEDDLVTMDLGPVIDGAGWIFHQAAQAGVRASWGEEFHVYTENNVYATQRLLEAARSASIEKLVYASSSSIYGDTEDLPMRETGLPRPVSPYGVSKLAAEHLTWLYHRNFGLPTVALRYFTVYGPRQRPDMAFHRFLRAAREGSELVLYDDGKQSRDFTYVADAIEANCAAALRGRPGAVYNVGGGSRITLEEVFEKIGRISGKSLRIRREPRQQGDVRHTEADGSLARRELDWSPRVSIDEGLEAEWRWIASFVAERNV